MSPFEAVSYRLGQALRDLSRRAQVAVLLCASKVLMPEYLDWIVRSGTDDQSDLLREALEVVTRFAVGTAVPHREGLMDSVEEATPGDSSDVSGFTAAQDCWICADSALRVSVGAFAVEDAAWYLLEPIFQSTSERLFGVSDVGSQTQAAAEVEALEDPALASAIHGIEEAIALLMGRPSPDVGDLARITEALRPLNQ
jgi:hypothetical protein